MGTMNGFFIQRKEGEKIEKITKILLQQKDWMSTWSLSKAIYGSTGWTTTLKMTLLKMLHYYSKENKEEYVLEHKGIGRGDYWRLVKR